jgi:predicted MFS family arabinose efflux permease
MLVTAWNVAIGAGGIIGGFLLELLGAGFLPGALIILLLPALWLAKKHGFPS